jgi:hypothetical protein
MRARFVFRGGHDWARMPSWPHPDYPLLLPLSVTGLWGYQGGETVLAPIVLSLGAVALSLGLVVLALAAARDRSQALLGGITLLTLPSFLIEGGAQTADVPLGVFYLATAICVVLSARPGEPAAGWWLLAGLFAGLAAWTKNEGLVFAGAVAAAGVIRAIASRDGGRWSELGMVLAGLAVPAVAILLFKTGLAPASEFLSQGPDALLAALRDPRRHAEILRRLWVEVLRLGSWDVGVVVTPLLAGYGLLVGLDETAARQEGPRIASLVLLATAAAYCAAYAASPYDLEWHLGSSMSRILLHFWPAGVFLFFAVVSSPAEGALPRAPAG